MIVSPWQIVAPLQEWVLGLLRKVKKKKEIQYLNLQADKQFLQTGL
jgi:hypothetical protein